MESPAAEGALPAKVPCCPQCAVATVLPWPKAPFQLLLGQLYYCKSQHPRAAQARLRGLADGQALQGLKACEFGRSMKKRLNPPAGAIGPTGQLKDQV